MKIALPLLCALLAAPAFADTTIRVDVDTGSGAISTRSFDTAVGHSFNDPAHVTAFLTGTLGQDESWLDLSYGGGSWQYFSSVRDADNATLPFAALERRVVPAAGGSHISEHFRVGLSRGYLSAHSAQGASLTISGKTGTINVTLPAVFIHDYLETADQALASQATQVATHRQQQFGAQYVALESGFAHVLGLASAQGLLVTRVQAGGIAAGAGLQQGDVLLELGGTVLTSEVVLDSLLAHEVGGASSTLKYWRPGSSGVAPVKLQF